MTTREEEMLRQICNNKRMSFDEFFIIMKACHSLSGAACTRRLQKWRLCWTTEARRVPPHGPPRHVRRPALGPNSGHEWPLFATMPGPDLLYSAMLGLGGKPLKRREFITRAAASKVPTVAVAFGPKRDSNARQAFDHWCFHHDLHAPHHAVRPS
jgi:hypothetical protein